MRKIFWFSLNQNGLTFELFSVMVHSGSAAGGHYYACIKSFSDGQWYSFNDQHVSKVSMNCVLLENMHVDRMMHRTIRRSLYTYIIYIYNIFCNFYMLLITSPVVLVYCQYRSKCVCFTDHAGRYQKDAWGIHREQRLLFQCLCKVSCCSVVWGSSRLVVNWIAP